MNVKTVEPNIFRINGRSHYFRRVTKIEKIAPAIWEGELVSGLKFKIEGGKKSGGSSSDWFLDVDGWKGSINCASFIDAIQTINNA